MKRPDSDTVAILQQAAGSLRIALRGVAVLGEKAGYAERNGQALEEIGLALRFALEAGRRLLAEEASPFERGEFVIGAKGDHETPPARVIAVHPPEGPSKAGGRPFALTCLVDLGEDPLILDETFTIRQIPFTPRVAS